ncbi:MAG: GtrA family protein, partial [Kosmotoga sp.]
MVKKFAKFILTNVSGTIIDTIALWILKSYMFNSYIGTYIISPIIGFELAMLNNFVISYFWIWHKRVHYNSRDFFKKLLKYNLSVSFTFGLR